MTHANRLAVGLLTLALLRLALTLVHSSAAWALDGLRFIPPALAILLGLASLLALLPAVGRRLAPGVGRVGDALADGDVRALAACALGTAGVVFSFPDRTLFVGDALLRNDIVGVRLELLAPGGPGQFLPLDRLLHVDLPRWFAAHTTLNAPLFARLLGAVEAAGLALLAAAWVRVLALRGVAAFVAWTATVGGGYLLLFGGYGKASVEMTLAGLAVCVLSLRLVRTGQGSGALGWVLVAALLMHRTALLLVPAGVVALIASAPRRARVPWFAWLPWLGLAGLAVALAPRLLATVTGYDVRQHLAPGDIGWAGGLFEGSTAGLRLLDLLNLALWMAPLVPLLPLVSGGGGRADPGARAERRVGFALVLPQIATMLLVLPHQGLPRDWDVFAPAGGVLAAWTAAAIAGFLVRRPEVSRLGAALALAVVVPLVAGFVTQASVDHGLARVRSFVDEPPFRGDRLNAHFWDFLGSRYHDLAGPGAEADAFRRSAEHAPNPRVIHSWARAAEQAGRKAEALTAYRRLVARDSTSTQGWFAIGRLAVDAGDIETGWEAAVRLKALDPDDPKIRQVHATMDSLRRATGGSPDD